MVSFHHFPYVGLHASTDRHTKTRACAHTHTLTFTLLRNRVWVVPSCQDVGVFSGAPSVNRCTISENVLVRQSPLGFRKEEIED